ncbi:MAG: hypothetical protein OK455_01740 [Thaumarchaeota archaeon]|nr:hypothetical protein [Nitrososphaerota archaeon]
MKGPLVAAALVVILLAGAGGAYLFLHSPSTPTSSTSSNTGTSQSSSSTSITISQTQSTQRTTNSQFTSATAQVTASVVACDANKGACIIRLVNAGGTAAAATGCTLNGLPGVFVAASGGVPPGGSVNVSCAPSAGGAVPIPGFHVEGFIQLGDGSSVHYTGTWT